MMNVFAALSKHLLTVNLILQKIIVKDKIGVPQFVER